MKISQNGNRYQISDGSSTLAVLDSREAAEARMIEIETEQREERLAASRDRHERREARRAELQAMDFYSYTGRDAGYMAVAAAAIGMTLLGQRNHMDARGTATVYAATAGTSYPDGWTECDEATKDRRIEEIVSDETPYDY